MPYQHLPAQISKTGFVLENQIAQMLKAAKWTVISNRYYVDDAEESVREIDLIAYQATRVQYFDLYTTLIISCKKSETNAWALLARSLDMKDPNSDWQPLHAWSNDQVIEYLLGKPDNAKRYHTGVVRLGVGNVLQTPAVEVFAFQEMNKTTGAPQNDKNIFNAVTSLMKAQAYELGALSQRKKTPSVYQFNLLSIVDADLVRLMFEDEAINAREVDSEHYIARYIIRKKETFSRIRFVRAETFASLLPEYQALHSANCAWFGAEHGAFYKDIMQDGERVAVLLEEFRKKAGWMIKWSLSAKNLSIEAESLTLSWNAKKHLVEISGPYTEAGAAILNDDATTKTRIAKTLESLYRYSGLFEFMDDELPF